MSESASVGAQGPRAIRGQAPATRAGLRSALYGGDIFLLAPTEASRRAVAAANEVLAAELAVSDIRAAHRELDEAAFFERIGRVRRALFCDPAWHAVVEAVVDDLGFADGPFAFDPIRLRVVAHRGHENPRARSVYYPHRDTWYAHPAAVVTWWIPLHDLGEAETFWLYPDAFERPIDNDSEVFDYRDWVRDGWELKIGWQQRDAGLTARYPGVVGRPSPGRALAFACRRGDNLLFSGAHFHQTRPQSLGQTRYSLDFRVVSLADSRGGLGAPNVDNRSRGSALVDYTRAARP